MHTYCPRPKEGKAEFYRTYARDLRGKGSAEIPPYCLFSREEIDRFNAMFSVLPEEKIGGSPDDLHDGFAYRILNDDPGESPTIVNRPFSDELLSIVLDSERRFIYSGLFGLTSKHIARRCQLNRIAPGGFVGRHRDTGANPDYEYSLIVSLGSDFDGGEFAVYPDFPDRSTEQIYSSRRGTVLVVLSRLCHEVRKVRAQERRSLIIFFSEYAGANRLGEQRSNAID